MKKFRIIFILFISVVAFTFAEDLSTKGKFTVGTFSDATYTYDEEYFVKQGTFYFPKNTSGKLPCAIMIHGWNGSADGFVPFAEHMASHGTIVFLYSAIDMAKPFQWPDHIIAAYHIVENENKRRGSVLYNKIDESKIALIGHSMGGSGVLHTTANESPNGLKGKIKTVLALNPYNGGPDMIDLVGGKNVEMKENVAGINVPTIIITGSADAVASPWNSYAFFPTIKENVKRVFISVKGMGHIDWYGNKPNEDYLKTMKKVLVAWLYAYLQDKSEYRSYFEDVSGSNFQTQIKVKLANKPLPLLPPAAKQKPFPAYEIK